MKRTNDSLKLFDWHEEWLTLAMASLASTEQKEATLRKLEERKPNMRSIWIVISKRLPQISCGWKQSARNCFETF